MEKGKKIPENAKHLKQVSNTKPSARFTNEPVLTNGCETGVRATHINFQRQNEVINEQNGCVAFGLQCNGTNLAVELEQEDSKQHQTQETDSCDKRNGRRETEVRKELKASINGLDLRLNGTGYSRNVCSVYRHENDLIFGRTRGGILNNQETVVVDNHVSNGVNESVKINGHIEEHSVISREFSLNEREVQGLTAPLAVPESFSDDESVHEDENQTTQACFIANGLTNDHSSVSHVVEHIPQETSVSCIKRSEDSARDEILNCSVSSDSLNCDDFEQDDNDDDDDDNDVKQNGAQDGKSSESDLEGLIENLELQENQMEDQVGEVELDNVEVVETEIDSNDDIGDFIEADLPPNVERLAFFSRDSTSDEDEGCGDEVLPNNDEDVISDNETIDPTDGGYVSPSRHSEQKVLNSEQSSYGASNVLSATSGSVRGEIGGFFPCNISCDKSSEENDDYILSSDCRCSEKSEDTECVSCNMLSHTGNSSVSGDRESNTGSKYNLCACCDRPMVVDSEHQQELGVNVCDKCFKELNAEQSRWFDNGAKHKTWPGTRSGSSSNYLNRNCGGLLMPFNNSDKVSNNSFTCARLSSSDSDAYDRLYVSDSSEMVSPDADTGTESVFQSSSLSSSGGTVVQYRQSSDDRSRGAESRQLHRQSISLDFTCLEQVVYCPYYTRRSRSLDQDLTQLHDQLPNADRSLESDEPNISISSSNFQDDKVNTQEKVFEKQAYNVPVSGASCNVPLTIPSCSSSDEEENIRMPGVDEEDMTGISVFDLDSFQMAQSDLASNLEIANDNMLYGANKKGKHSRGHKMRLDENEPIYEDIDQLQLLLEDGERDSESNRNGAAQPLCNAITKLRRKRRTRSPVSDVEKVMIWNEYEAYVVQVKQIGTSACGPTAVLNVLKAFDFQVEKEEVAHTIRSNCRMEAAPIPYYLFSRYNAGTTAQDLVDGVAAVTRGAIRGRFFHFYPPREVELLKWLGHWMKKGAVPVATLNLQRGVKPGWTIPDAWHHQMVYGVSCKGVYLTNPLEIVPQSVIMEQLTSDSVLLVRRQDVVGRFRDWCPLNEIIKQQDPRWRTMNVLGQVVHMLREQYMPAEQMAAMKSQVTSHVCIPAAYKAGIILFMRANCLAMEELMQAPDLPLKEQLQTEI